MGLDMYLDKVRKVDKNATLKKINAVNEYYGWRERDDKYRDYSMKKWCGVDISEVDMELAKKYEDEYIHRYAAWDPDYEYSFRSVYQEIAYWRKANQIHSWFVENVQNGVDDCGSYEVTKEQLEELLDLCEAVKEKPKLAHKLLPTQSGFFFGSTEYDEWYMQDIDNTIKQLKKVLKETDFDNWIVFYTASW